MQFVLEGMVRVVLGTVVGAAVAALSSRALANNPRLIPADEPTGTLDEQTGEPIIALLRRLPQEKKTTIVAATHDHAHAWETDGKFRLSHGKITED